MANTRIWGNLPEERYEQMRAWADELGLAFSQYVGLVAWMGAQNLNRTLHPESVLTPEQWAGIVKAYADLQGVEVDISKLDPEVAALVGDKLQS